MGRLAGQVAVITGGAQGIGRAAVEKFLAEGARAWFLDIDEAAGRATADALGAPFLRADVTVEADVQRAMETVLAAEGRIDTLVANAGRNAYHLAADLSTDEWQRSIDLNLKAAWLCAKHVLPAMTGQRAGSIVIVSSLHARMTTTGMFPYAAAKAGLAGMARSLAVDYGPHGIRVNAVLPGWTHTPAVDDWLARQPDPARAIGDIHAVHPLRKIADPSEVAAVIAFLASPEASSITGAEMVVDNGLSARYAG
jgi:NAD(P)-dependent dehydrogenase (short-subunit alcohol dehydrogenase family)